MYDALACVIFAAPWYEIKGGAYGQTCWRCGLLRRCAAAAVRSKRMAKLSLPEELRALLSGSNFEPAVTEFAVRARDVLCDNTMPFFPAFTSHGVDHAEAVLRVCVRLIPSDVWRAGVLTASDAASLVCAALLHDLGMHVRERGFASLVERGSCFGPLPFFDRQHEARAADAPWSDLWSAFQDEARHWGPGKLAVILGPSNSGVPAVAFADEIAPEELKEPDRLLIGEFLRRHHARLSHEIAVAGFPGAGSEFPVIARTLPQIGELAGAIARSHNEDLRFMLRYLEDLEPGNRRPNGVLAVYHMGLLRISDYLQIEADRAPPLLLRLKTPQSRMSIEEWNKHGAVQSVSWDHADPFAIAVSVSPNHGLRAHLALKELLDALQRELDRTWAVLDEYYSSGRLRRLRLSRRRVVSNIDQASLHRQLPYFPHHAALRSDPDLFRLMVRDLYSGEQYVAGRELVQNAADAVRMRRLWERLHGPVLEADLLQLEADIVVTLDAEEGDPKRLVLRIRDRGIGMLPETIADYYLKAGASFGLSTGELEAMDTEDAIGAMKAGRFGIGAFAAFLLGREIRVTTRHVETERAVCFRARIDEEMVQIDWTTAPIGTTVEIPFDASRLESVTTPLFFLGTIAETYRLADPAVVYRVGGESVPPPADVPHPGQPPDEDWFEIATGSVEAAYWRVSARDLPRPDYDEDDDAIPSYSLNDGALVHNGIVVERHYQDPPMGGYEWSDWRLSLNKPVVAVFDPRHTVPLALHRFELVDDVLPFEADLLASVATHLVVHALVCGYERHPLVSRQKWTVGGDGLETPVHSVNGFLPPIAALIPPVEDFELHLAGLNTQLHAGLRHGRRSSAFRFLTDQSYMAWQPHVHRALGGPESNSPFDGPHPRASALPGALEHVRDAALQVARHSYARDAQTIVVAKNLAKQRWNGQSDGEIPERTWGWPSGGEWHHLGRIPKTRSTRVFLVGARDATPNDGAVAAAIELSRIAKGDWTCLTVLRDFVPSDAAHALGAAWRAHLDGFVPFDPERRTALAGEVERQHPATQPYFEHWRDVQSRKPAGGTGSRSRDPESAYLR